MNVTVPSVKADDIKTVVRQTMTQTTISVCHFAAIVGKLAATLPANPYGQLFIKHLAMAKTSPGT